MPRVLRIINRLNLGGPTYNAANLTKYLDSDFETMLVSGMTDDTEQSSQFILDKLDLHPVYIREMYRELNPFKDYKAYFKIREIIREFKPDIVHTHAAKAGAVGRLAAWHERVPVIVHTFHGHVFHSYFGPLKTRAFLEIERYLARRTDAIVTLSDIQRNELADQFKVAPRDKFEIIPLGFDLSKFIEDKERKRKQFRDQYHIADDEIVISIVGRLVPIKNHDLFLRAIKLVSERSTKKIRAFIIGDGELRPQVELLARDLGLPFGPQPQGSPRLLTFTSWIRDIDVSNAGSDIIALTSLNEGTPVSLIEAQASGKPIVSTKVGGIANILVEGETGLLSQSGDVESFAGNLLQLVEDDHLRHAMSDKGVAHVLKNFSHLRLAQDMGALYRRLLSRGR
ncbi:MAG: glycosyltransferase [Bacteroidetes bacterium]|nr:glycosyltransferase [Bacteroidota bacterium]